MVSPLRKSKRLLGPLSLAVTASGLAVIETLLHFGLISGVVWRVLLSGFEAGTVGGLADWYAVSALFHYVPIPILGRHSNIIIRNRKRITENIVDMVQNKWLAPEVIGGYLRKYPFASSLLEYFEQGKNQDNALRLAHDTIAKLALELDRPEVAEFLEGILKEQLMEVNLARPLGAWLVQAARQGEHDAVWTALLASVEANIKSAQTRPLVRKLTQDAIQRYLPVILAQAQRPELVDFLASHLEQKLKDLKLSRPLGEWLEKAVETGGHGPLLDSMLETLHTELFSDKVLETKLAGTVTEAVAAYRQSHGKFKTRALETMLWAIGREKAAHSLALAIGTLIEGIRVNKDNAVRKKLEQALFGYARKLSQGDPLTVDAAENFKNKFVERADWKALVASFMNTVNETIQAELTNASPNPSEQLIAPGTPAGVETPCRLEACATRSVRLIDLDALTEVAVNAASTLVRNMNENRTHVLRAKLDGMLAEFALKLAEGDAQTLDLVERFKSQLIESGEIKTLLRSALSRLKAGILAQLNSPESPLPNAIKQFLKSLRDSLSTNPAKRARLDEWVQSTLQELIVKHHAMIGGMMRSSLDPLNLSDEALIDQIEGKVGEDLQFIRLNGAVVGFLAGIVLAGLKLLTGI